MVEEVVAHLVEERLGVEVEPGLGAVPAGVPETGATGHRPVIHSGVPATGHAPLISIAPVPSGRPAGDHNAGDARAPGPSRSSPCARPGRGSPPAHDDSRQSLPTPSKAFCQAAYDYDTNLPKLIGKFDQQIDLVAKLAEHAPKDIAADAQMYLDAMQRRPAGDRSVVDNPKIETGRRAT